MSKTKGYAAKAAKASLAPFSFERRQPREHDVAIDIKFCGICHSDIHQARDEWGRSAFPMVPGHEIAGVVTATRGQKGGYIMQRDPASLTLLDLVKIARRPDHGVGDILIETPRPGQCARRSSPDGPAGDRPSYL